VALAIGLVLGNAVLDTGTAKAQCTMASPMCTNQVGADGKGALGGGILGAEIGFMVNALIVNAGVRELDEWWAWILFPAVGAAGGAIGGFYGLEDPNMGQGFPEVAVAVFAVSMALIVPTFVGVLALTAYNPGPDTGGTGATSDEDEAAGDEAPAASPDSSSDSSAGRSARERVLAGGPGLLRLDRGQVLLGVPMISSADTYTPEERAHMQLPRMADVRIPLVSGTF
jgi:hypothetical protein